MNKKQKNKVMGRTKEAKNKPKKEVIKMKAKDVEFKTIDEIIAEDNAKVSVKIELKVTKDDILSLLLERKEKQLEKVIDKEFKSLVELNKKRAKIYKDIYEELAHPEYKEKIKGQIENSYRHDPSDEDPSDENYFRYSHRNHYMSFLENITNHTYKEYACYHITRLSGYANPKIAVEQNKYIRHYTMTYELKDYSMSHNYGIRNSYTLEPMNSEELEKFEKQINELNAIYQETEKVEKSLRENQYNLLIFDKDRSIRNELTKAIITGIDVRTLLNE